VGERKIRAAGALPLAVFLGLLAIAAAVYFGLSAQRQGAPSVPLVEPTPPPAAAAQPHFSPSPQALVDRVRDRWALVAPTVAQKCWPVDRVKLSPEVWHVDLPVELSFSAAGEAIDVRAQLPLRTVNNDGVHHALVTQDAGLIGRCYEQAIATHLRLGALDQPGPVTTALRLLSVAP
jgi:hypothetical protein